MLTAEEKSSYDSTVIALKKRFHSLDIEELRGLEFHQLKQTVGEIGVHLQKLARKAFPGSNQKEFDRMLKGRFYQALLPKWQRKLGAPKAAETFDDLYSRARILERHDQQFNARRGEVKPQSDRSHKSGPPKESKPTESAPPSSGQPVPRGSGRNFGRHKPRVRICYDCGEPGHIGKDCPTRGTESPGKSGKVSSVIVDTTTEEMTIPELEQLIATKRLAAEKGQLGEGVAKIGTITSDTSSSSSVAKINVDARML